MKRGMGPEERAAKEARHTTPIVYARDGDCSKRCTVCEDRDIAIQRSYEKLLSDPPDPVNHPPHYTAHPSGVECITVTEHMTFNAGNAVKYLWRAGLKDSTPVLTDLKKAQWYIAREIQRVERGVK